MAANKKHPNIIAIEAPITITAGESEGENKSPPKFSVTAYTGGAMELNGWDHPVVVDLDGMEFGKSLIANLEHDAKQRVGHVTEKSKDGNQLTLGGVVSSTTAAAKEVVADAGQDFPWQASIEASPQKLETVKAKQTVQVNGQTFTGPLYVARKSVLKGFAFVSHGADDNTTASIAATAASPQEKKMDSKLRAWIEAMLPGTDVDSLSEDALANLEANYNGQHKKAERDSLADPVEGHRLEAERRADITASADKSCQLLIEAERNVDPSLIATIQKMRDDAIEGKKSVKDFRHDLELVTRFRVAPTQHVVKGRQLTNRIVEAAICATGGLEDLDKHFDDQTLQAAHDHFPHGISLGELILIAAESNGYRSTTKKVTIEAHNAAFGFNGRSQGNIYASGMFSTLSLPTTFSNVANKFIRESFMHVDSAWRDISVVRPVSDFKQITTVSLTGGLMFEKLNEGGEITHGDISEVVYNNKADTYARMFAIPRQAIINDDLGALTQIARRLGRGAALRLNLIFWTEFLDNASFFTTARGNEIESNAVLNLAGLENANTTFRLQTDPDGNPLGARPRILLVPVSLEATALQLMTSEKLKGDLDEPDANVWRNRFQVVSSEYLEDANISGSSSSAWYLLASPMDIPVMEVAALNGRIEPNVDTADADFNVLGIQMRGYSDVGVAKQEFRGGVRADGTET